MPGAPGDAARRGGFGVGEHRATQSVVVDLETALRDWFGAADPADAVRLVRGGPGSGKSTTARKVAADLAAGGRMRVLYFALQHFRMSGKLSDAVGDALGPDGAEAFFENPLKQPHFASAERPVLLIFDGLDELAQPGRDADQQTRAFLEELRVSLDRWNERHCRVFALVTGRSAVVQANRDILRLFGRQELEVLPFFVGPALADKRRDENRPFHDPAALLAEDQRAIWWGRYARCKPGEPAKIPESLAANDVRDLSAEPLLLYLLVLSGYHRRPVGARAVNRNEIYAALFHNVAERLHDGRRGPAPRHELGEEEFEQVMEIIATAAWYGDGRTATVEDIRRCCPQHLEKKLERFLVSEAGVARLIAAFYFQRADAARRRDAIEFTHKSFGEYLTARRLARTVSEIHEELNRRSPRYGEVQALQEWFDLTRPTAMDMDLLRFVRDEVQLRAGEAADWQASLTRLLNWELHHGMPVRLSEEVTFRIGEQQARNAEEALLALLNASALATRKCSTPEWPSSVAAGELLHRLRRQRATKNFPSLALACLAFIDCAGQVLLGQELAGADLYGAVLTEATLTGADLSGANLRGAVLERANFERCILDEADLTEANLMAATLWRVSAENANFTSAILEDATLELGNIARARMQRANLTRANLERTTAGYTDLRFANLDGAYLRRAGLKNGILENASLRGSILRRADLRYANLKNANCESAHLEWANLEGADLKRANFHLANLADAMLADAEIEGTTFEGAILKGTVLEGAEH